MGIIYASHFSVRILGHKAREKLPMVYTRHLVRWYIYQWTILYLDLTMELSGMSEAFPGIAAVMAVDTRLNKWRR